MSDLIDYIVIGSGFGGSVAALRLAEKGYSVVVLEAGKRFMSHDFPKSNWNLRRFLYFPSVGCHGILRIDFFKRLFVLSGAGVGGGSLVYANTLIEPPSQAFQKGSWPDLEDVTDWRAELKPYFQIAKNMLGVASAPHHFAADHALKETAESLGFGSTFEAVDVGVYFGSPGVGHADPYFGGEGPPRKGCILCGGCMVGCRHNAKNTLDKNYLWFAEKRGATIIPESHVEKIVSQGDKIYQLDILTPGAIFRRRRQMRAKNVVIAAGTLGTLKLLFKCRDVYKVLPFISPKLGEDVRTNSESILGVRMNDSSVDFSQGVAISSLVHPNSHTKIEAVRYPKGSDSLGIFVNPLVEGKHILSRCIQTLLQYICHPIQTVKTQWPMGFATKTLILLVMQTLDNKITMKLKRNFLGQRRLSTSLENGSLPPVLIEEGVQFAKKLSERTGGIPKGSKLDLLNSSVTAHILGGCPMSVDASQGVIDSHHRVHGYPGLFVLGGGGIPANLGVNPSLTITAMAERAMNKIPPKNALE